MSEAARGGAAEGEAPVNPYTLLGSVNQSSGTAHTGWLIFIAILSYLLVAVAGVTHKDLLLARDIQLPMLQVGIELSRFFLFAPFLLVLFHMGIITQLVMVARKALEFDGALRIMEATDRRTHPLRLEVDNFFFVQAIAGPERSRVVNGLLHAMTWLTLVVLPVVLLLYIQLVFLPYHDVAISWAHRIALVADIALLGCLGAFLSRSEQSLPGALLGVVRGHPLTALATVVVFAAVASFSFLVATVPGERLDRLAGGFMPGASRQASLGDGPAAFGFMLPFAGLTTDGRLFGIFERNLHVTDHDLVVDRNVTPGEPSLNLRRRDLRHARLDRTDLHQADLTGANLDGASLVAADLRGVAIHCADLGLLVLTGDRRAASCPSARGANFGRARLGEAVLHGLDLAGSRLEEADLSGANLAHADLTGANLYGARLERVEATGGVMLRGANLAGASLQGADLTGASLHGADLDNAGLQGAVLEFASLHGASLRDADLDGANLFQARLPGADLSGAVVRGASLREAWIWRALPPTRASAGLADLEGVRAGAADKPEIEALEAMLNRIGDSRLRNRLRERLAGLLAPDGGGARPSSWNEVAEASRNADLEPRLVATSAAALPGGSVVAGLGTVTDAGPATAARGGGDRAQRLTRYLAGLACKARWANGSVATGLARRAQSVAFNGDAAALQERLTAADCAPGKAIPPAVLRRLADSVERQRAN